MTNNVFIFYFNKGSNKSLLAPKTKNKHDFGLYCSFLTLNKIVEKSINLLFKSVLLFKQLK